MPTHLTPRRRYYSFPDFVMDLFCFPPFFFCWRNFDGTIRIIMWMIQYYGNTHISDDFIAPKARVDHTKSHTIVDKLSVTFILRGSVGPGCVAVRQNAKQSGWHTPGGNT